MIHKTGMDFKIDLTKINLPPLDNHLLHHNINMFPTLPANYPQSLLWYALGFNTNPKYLDLYECPPLRSQTVNISSPPLLVPNSEN